MSIGDGEPVCVSTPHGQATVQARVTDDIRVGVVSLQHGWGREVYHPETRVAPERQGTNANLLTGDENLDPLCRPSDRGIRGRRPAENGLASEGGLRIMLGSAGW